MTLAQLRAQALNRLGVLPWEEEAPVLNFALARNAINDAYRWFAARTLCHYDHDRSEAVTTPTARYALDADVIRLKVDAVRFLLTAGGTYTQLEQRRLGSLIVQYGALEGASTGTPAAYHAEMGGEANDAPAVIRLVPAPSGNGTLYYGCYYYPAELTAETDRPQLSEAEQHRLIAPICWKLAEAARGAGNEIADPARWEAQAEREAAEFYALLHGGGIPRFQGRAETPLTGGRK